MDGIEGKKFYRIEDREALMEGQTNWILY